MKCKKGYKKKLGMCMKINKKGTKKKKSKWKILLVIFAVATLIDLFVPDPLPFVDEIALIFLTLLSLYKTTISK